MQILHCISIHCLILLHWVFYAVVFSLLGRMTLRLGAKSCCNSFWDATWTGIFIAIGLLQIWHFFLPITFLPLGILTIVAAVEAFKTRQSSFTLLRFNETGLLALAALAALWLAQKSLDPNFHYDSEAYDFATIRSNAELPLIPGMANLYIYYGLNQSYFLFAALLDKTSLLPMGCLITNGFLILLLSCESIYASRQLLRYPQQKVLPSALFLCLALPFVLKLGLNGLGSEVAPESWTGGIVKSRTVNDPASCPRNVVHSVPSSKPRSGLRPSRASSRST